MSLAAAQALAEIIVGVAFEFERHALRGMNAPKLWPGAAVEFQLHRVFGQTRAAHAACVISLPTMRADDAVHVDDRQLGVHLFAALDAPACRCRSSLRDVERFFQTVILRPAGGSGRLPAATSG
jgi:hypothetical protein